MKILQIIDQFYTGGAERVCIDLSNLLNKNGYDVKILVFDNVGPLFKIINKEIEVVSLNKSKSSKNEAQKLLIEEVNKADIIHIHVRTNYKYVRKALLKNRIKKKVILHDHYGKIAINKRVSNFYRFISKPDFYIGCSQMLADWAIKRVRIKKERVFFIKNFVIKHINDIDLQKSQQKNGIVLVANLRYEKNHIFAVKIAKALNENLTIYCTENKDDYYKSLVLEIKKLNMTESVHFIHDCITVQKEFYKYKFGVLTSKTEGDPLALIEYLAQGLPFLCCDFGESVKAIKTKFPFFVQDSYELNKWVYNSKKLEQVDRKNIEELYNDHYSEDVFLDKYLNIYNQIP